MPLPVAVKVSGNTPALNPVIIVIFAVLEPAAIVTVFAPKPAGGLVRVTSTAPVNPFTRVRVRFKSAELSVKAVRLEGVKLRLKSGFETSSTLNASAALWLKPPEIALMFKLLETSAAFAVVLTVIVPLLEPLAITMFAALTPAGGLVRLSVIGSSKPFKRVTSIFTSPFEPCFKLKLAGVRAITKSGLEAAVTFKVKLEDLFWPPLTPVRLSVIAPGVTVSSAVMFKVPTLESAVIVMLAAVTPTGGLARVMSTAPANPFCRSRLMLTLPLEPWVTVRLEGVLVMAKSGVVLGGGVGVLPPPHAARTKASMGANIRLDFNFMVEPPGDSSQRHGENRERRGMRPEA